MTKQYEEIYYGREKPAARDWGGRLPVALVFPQEPGLGLSSLGWQVVYRVLHSLPEVAVERVFSGADPREEPRSFDSPRPLAQFPLLAFSLGFEEDFLTLVRVLLAANLPPLARKRPDLFPFVLAGGPLAFMNPAPVAPFVDAFWVGEAEAGLPAFIDACREAWFAGMDKDAFLTQVAAMDGIYVPGRSRTPVRRVLSPGPDLQTPASSCFISSEAEFKDMLLVEVNRGCPYGCRFCAAGFVYRPPRQASLESLEAVVERAAPRKVGLIGTALTDWPELMPFLVWLKERGVKFALSSLRADGITREFMEFLRTSGVRTMTLALEGASARLRRAANKKLKEEDFLNAVRLAAEFGVNHLKIYLILGWPGETDDDYAELADFLARIQDARREGQGNRKKGLDLITVGTSCLTPKPWTPFQWAPMATEEQLEHVIDRVRRMVRPLKGFAFKADKPWQARLQALLSRGDERLADLLLLAADKGGLRRGLKAWDGDISTYLDHERARDESFPWEVIDIGVDRSYLWDEWTRYKDAKASHKCPPKGCESCKACGMDAWLREDASGGRGETDRGE